MERDAPSERRVRSLSELVPTLLDGGGGAATAEGAGELADHPAGRRGDRLRGRAGADGCCCGMDAAGVGDSSDLELADKLAQLLDRLNILTADYA